MNLKKGLQRIKGLIRAVWQKMVVFLWYNIRVSILANYKGDDMFIKKAVTGGCYGRHFHVRAF